MKSGFSTLPYIDNQLLFGMDSIGYRKTDWQLICALAALDAGILISWTAYHNFQPKLLLHFHFDHLKGFLLIAQSVVMLSVPLVAGLLTDFYRNRTGTGFNVFAIGIAVASVIFMAVAFTISDQTFMNLVWLLPILIIFWLISMNIFHSPANSVLEAFSRSPALPSMMAILVIAKVVVNGAQPILLYELEKAGSTLTFVTGGLILVVSGIWFSRATKNMSLSHHESPGEDKDRFHLVLMAGLLAGLCNVMILHFYPDILKSKFGARESIFHERIYISILLGVTALAAFPLSKLVKTKDAYPMLVISLLCSFVAMLVILVSGSIAIVSIGSLVLALSYGMVLITAFPYALHNISVKNATFGTGLFFAGFEFFEIFFSLLGAH
jgi:hypothetical protein